MSGRLFVKLPKAAALYGMLATMAVLRRAAVVLAVMAIAVTGCGTRYLSVCEMFSSAEIESVLGGRPSDGGPMADVAGCRWSRPSDEPLIPYMVWVSVVPVEPGDQPLPADPSTQALPGLDHPAAWTPGFDLTLVTGDRRIDVDWNDGALGDTERERAVLVPFADMLVRRVPDLAWWNRALGVGRGRSARR